KPVPSPALSLVPLPAALPISQFDIRNHVRAVVCREPRDEPALLDTAMSLITARLRRSEPLWAAVLVTGLADGRAALVFVAHHARSEEHTSELQSLTNLVCRLL